MQRIFGPVMQNAWVVDDLDAALDHWINKMGVGPFYLFEHVKFQEIYFRGQPATTDMTAAIAYWGDMQNRTDQTIQRRPFDLPGVSSQGTARHAAHGRDDVEPGRASPAAEALGHRAHTVGIDARGNAVVCLCQQRFSPGRNRSN